VRRGVAAALTLAALAVLMSVAEGHQPPRPGRPCPGETDAVQVAGQWTVIKSPLESLTGHATSGVDGKRVLATDGRRIQRSGDGGCTWQESFDAGDASVAGVTPSVEAVTFPGGSRRAFALLAGVGRAGLSRLIASDDGGATWQESSGGLPLVGGLRLLTGVRERLYITTSLGDATGELYTSADGGRSWTLASQGDAILSIAVDPVNPRTVYVVRASHVVERSADAGASFTPLTLPGVPDDPSDPGGLDDLDPTAPDRNGSWRAIAVAHRRGYEAVVVVTAAPSPVASVTRIAASNDSGRSFLDLPTDGLGPLGGLTFGNSPAQIVFAAGSHSTAFRGAGLLVYDLGYQVWRDVDDLELGSMREPDGFRASAASRGHKGYDDLQMRRDAVDKPDLITRFTPPDPPPGDFELSNKGPCGESTKGGLAGGHQPERVDFDPGALDFALEPGQPERVPLSAALRPVPSPLDVYFLIDSSESMDPAIDGVKCSAKRMVGQLFARGIDAWFGVGTYNDRFDTRYERRLDLSPPGPRLGRALDHLFTRRGLEEPIRTGLFQTATGAGLDITDDGGASGQVPVRVPPDQQANYRDGALHTVIVIGDEPYEDTTPGEPTVPDIIAALRRKAILALGVQVVPPFFQPINARDDGRLAHRQAILRQQLEAFARGSGALAPAGGVDCDGGGAPDIAAGQPLVCSVRQQGIQQSMSDTLVALLADLEDFGEIRLVPLETSGLSVSIEGAAAQRVDLKRPSSLAGTAVVSCTADQAGRTFALTFGVEAAGRIVGQLAGSARCGTVPQRSDPPAPTRPAPERPAPVPEPAKAPVAQLASVPPPPPPPAPVPQPAVAVAPPPPPPTPALVPGTAPAGAQAAASAPSAAAAAAPAPGALAQAPETAPAPRLAQAKVSDDAYALSAARESRAQVTPAAAITLGLGICAGFGWLVVAADRRRRPAQPAISPLRRAR
jgi:hypothetical protein